MNGAEGPSAIGAGMGARKGCCTGGVLVLATAVGWWTRTDLVTSSSQRSASDGVRL